MTSNLDMDNNITNGMKAMITNIVLHPQSAFVWQPDGVYELQASPLYILVKLDQFRSLGWTRSRSRAHQSGNDKLLGHSGQ